MKVLYKGPLYRVVHSTEEEAACLADGWQIAPEDGVQYIPHTAVEPAPILKPPAPEPTPAHEPAIKHAERLVEHAFDSVRNAITHKDPEPEPEKEPADVQPMAAVAPIVKRPYPVKFRPPVQQKAPQGE